MKKIYTFMAAAVMALTANAKDYVDQLSITLNGSEPFVSEATITVNAVEGDEPSYTIVLNDFNFSSMLIGDVTITGVTGTTTSAAGGYTFFNEINDQEANITNGGAIATMLGNKVNVSIKPGSWMDDDELHLLISLPVVIPGLGQDFDVVAMFGDGGFQIPNSDFEEFHTATYTATGWDETTTDYTSDEPNAWHSFNSGVATGAFSSLTAMALQTGSTSISDEVRPGSTGTKSVLIKNTDVLGIAANGTMTTGQLQAGSLDATSTDNCSFLDFANEDVDDNGDPFYTVLTGIPDAVSVWVKFKQGKPADDGTETQAEGDGTTEGEEPTVYPYATMSAVITDGTRCQDPAPADASTANIVAKAQNNTIESNGAEWQHLVVPFDYDTYAANDITGKAILVTFSTNATPGQGSTNPDDRDELYVDDLELVYNAGLNKLAYNGTDIELQDGTYEYTIEDLNATEVTADQIEAVSDGRGAYVATSVNETQTGFRAVTIVTSNDFKTTNTYTLYINNVSTGIENVETDADNATEAIYTIGGQRVNELQKGVNIVRKANGTTVKVLKK